MFSKANRVDPKDLGDAGASSAPAPKRESQGNIEDWPAAWASDTIVVAHNAFAGTQFRQTSPGHWSISYTDPATKRNWPRPAIDY